MVYCRYRCVIWMEWLRKISKIIGLVKLWADFEHVARKQECYSLDQHVCCKVCCPWRSSCVVTQCSSLSGARNRAHSHSLLMWLYSWRRRHHLHPNPLYPSTGLQHGAILRNKNSFYYSRIRKWILSVLLTVCSSFCLSVCLYSCVHGLHPLLSDVFSSNFGI